MSFKKERRCSKFEHRECAPPVSKTDEKPPMENGGIVLTNVVSRIFSPFLALGLSQCVSLFLHGQGVRGLGGLHTRAGICICFS